MHQASYKGLVYVIVHGTTKYIRQKLKAPLFAHVRASFHTVL